MENFNCSLVIYPHTSHQRFLIQKHWNFNQPQARKVILWYSVQTRLISCSYPTYWCLWYLCHRTNSTRDNDHASIGLLPSLRVNLNYLQCFIAGRYEIQQYIHVSWKTISRKRVKYFLHTRRRVYWFDCTNVVLHEIVRQSHCLDASVMLLTGSKPSHQPMLIHLPLVPHICVNELGHHWSNRRLKMRLKMSSAKMATIFPGGDELTKVYDVI